MKEQANKTEWVHVRLSKEEHEQLSKAFAKTTCRKLSEYVRNILLGKPMVSIYRNKSLDDFMTEMVHLRIELNALGNNYNQAVKKLNILNRGDLAPAWVTTYEEDKKKFERCVENIEKHISKIADQWLQ
jgi:hypothetical protein